MFATVKWKEKLLCVASGCCVYFDSTTISTTSTCDKFLSLAGAYAEAGDGQLEAGAGAGAKTKTPNGAPWLFRVVAPARSFQFACATEAERAAWLAAFDEEIARAAELGMAP